MAYWLAKTEPTELSIDDLRTQRVARWEGVRNFRARNALRAMAKGDEVFVYHSSTKVPGVYGIAKVTKTAYADPDQFDPTSKYFDPTAKQDDPRWTSVDVRYVKHLKRPVTLTEIRDHEADLGHFPLLTAFRLSTMPVTDHQWEFIVDLSKRRAPT
jgi:predicted RNA-binding protein with PUA-like domain